MRSRLHLERSVAFSASSWWEGKSIFSRHNFPGYTIDSTVTSSSARSSLGISKGKDRDTMGWLKLGARKANEAKIQQGRREIFKGGSSQHFKHVEHVENIENAPIIIHNESKLKYSFAAPEVPNTALPFISPYEISKSETEMDRLLIVVGKIVCDCTEFMDEHPGGVHIVQSFAGQECSWQFWRFHGKEEMDEFGKALRVGRTKGMSNKYKEPVRYVGLRRLGNNDW